MKCFTCNAEIEDMKNCVSLELKSPSDPVLNRSEQICSKCAYGIVGRALYSDAINKKCNEG
jgi:hypothetical protein